MSADHRYSMLIQWSYEDDAFLVTLPEWEGIVMNPVTHGDTYAEAAANGEDALTALSASLSDDGQALPLPALKRSHSATTV